LRLLLSNIGLGFVHHYPWVNPVMSPFSIALVLGGPASAASDSASDSASTSASDSVSASASAFQATLALPFSNRFAALPDADTSAWEKPYWH
jgi:hypothetical protein